MTQMTSFVSGVQTRRPRVVLAGEFSTGKTRLLNELIGQRLLPSSVTSTSLPPIWLGAGAPLFRIHLTNQSFEDCSSTENLLGRVQALNLKEISHCEMRMGLAALADYDLIDTPGTSDPNMDQEAWLRLANSCDVVVWCTNIVQAWRQSEKSAWAEVSPHIAARSLMVLTHADLISDPLQRARIVARVEREAGGSFREILTAAINEPSDIARIKAALSSSVLALDVTQLGPDQGLTFLATTVAPQAGATDKGAETTSELRDPAPLIVFPRRIRPRSAERAEEDVQALTHQGNSGFTEHGPESRLSFSEPQPEQAPAPAATATQELVGQMEPPTLSEAAFSADETRRDAELERALAAPLDNVTASEPKAGLDFLLLQNPLPPEHRLAADAKEATDSANATGAAISQADETAALEEDGDAVMISKFLETLADEGYNASSGAASEVAPEHPEPGFEAVDLDALANDDAEPDDFVADEAAPGLLARSSDSEPEPEQASAVQHALEPAAPALAATLLASDEQTAVDLVALPQGLDFGPARLVWCEVAESADLSSVEGVLAAVEALVTRVDRDFALSVIMRHPELRPASVAPRPALFRRRREPVATPDGDTQ